MTVSLNGGRCTPCIRTRTQTSRSRIRRRVAGCCRIGSRFWSCVSVAGSPILTHRSKGLAAFLVNECKFLGGLWSVFTLGVIRRDAEAAATVASVVANDSPTPNSFSRRNARCSVVLDFVGPTIGLACVRWAGFSVFEATRWFHVLPYEAHLY